MSRSFWTLRTGIVHHSFLALMPGQRFVTDETSRVLTLIFFLHETARVRPWMRTKDTVIYDQHQRPRVT